MARRFTIELLLIWQLLAPSGLVWADIAAPRLASASGIYPARLVKVSPDVTPPRA